MVTRLPEVLNENCERVWALLPDPGYGRVSQPLRTLYSTDKFIFEIHRSPASISQVQRHDRERVFDCVDLLFGNPGQDPLVSPVSFHAKCRENLYCLWK